MDSINANQPEQNHLSLSDADARKKIKEIVEKVETCFFCTSVDTGGSHSARPMHLRAATDDGTLLFFSASDSHKNLEIETNNTVKLFFQSMATSEFLHLTGTASITNDKAKIRELWSPMMKTWFTEGVDDERITIISVTPREGYYWETKHGRAVAGIKMLVGAAIGITLDDSIEGMVRP